MILIHLCRKPVDAPTIGRNIQSFGCGALNIDGCRVGSEEMKVTASNGVIISSNRAMAAPNTGRVDMGTKTGRWPANVLFQHKSGCYVSGFQDVKGGAGTYCPQWPNECQGHGYERTLNGVTSHGAPPPGWVKPSGSENVPVWTCEPGCPIPGLDDQSGYSETPSQVVRGAEGPKSTNIMRNRRAYEVMECHGDAGGASRYFKHIGGQT